MPPKPLTVVEAGRKGGVANTPAQQAARARNGLQGGRPATYRLFRGKLQQRAPDGSWATLTPPYDGAAHDALYRLRRRHGVS